MNNNLLYNSMVIKNVDHAQFSNVLFFRSFWRKADISDSLQMFQTNTLNFIILLKPLSFSSPVASIPLLFMTISFVVPLHVCLSNTGFPKYFGGEHFWLRKIIANFHIHIEHPDDIHTELKLYISELILSSIYINAWN